MKAAGVFVAGMALFVASSVVSGAEVGPGPAGESRAEVLCKAVAGADRLVVKPVMQVGDGPPGGDREVVMTIEGVEKIAALVSGLSFDEELSRRGLCLCSGDRRILFFKGGVEVAGLSHRHGTTLGWVGWKGDAAGVFTGEGGAHWRRWFREHGYPAFHDEFVEEQRKQARAEQLQHAFLSHFPEKARPLFTERTEDMYEPDGFRDIITKEAQRGLVADLRAAFESEAELVGALCGAYGELNGSGPGSWRTGLYYMFLARWTAAGLDPNVFVEVVDGLDQPKDLLGAARLFFQEGVGRSLGRPVRKRLTAKLGEATLRHDKSGNGPAIFHWLAAMPSPEVDRIFLEVVSGKLSVKPDPYSLRQDPTPRATACLALAMHGHDEMEKLARAMLKKAEEGSSDEMALKLALYHFGDRKMWPEGVFEVWCDFLGRSALAILVKQGDREALDRIITKATEHPHAAIREEAVLAVELITGKRWYQRQENERAEWHAKEIREWWKEAGEDWPGKVD